MNGAIMRKTLRDAALLLTVLTLGIVLFELVAVRALVEAANDLALIRIWLDRPVVKMLLRVALGADLAGELTSTTLCTLMLVHPLYFALAWSLLLALGTNAIAGEIGRGTADLLLTLPVSRLAIYVSTSAALALAAALVSWAPLLGLWLGQRAFALQNSLEFARLWPVCANLLALNLALGGITMLASSLVSRRGTALGLLLGGIFVSDLINVLAQFWSVIRAVSFLGFLHYYRPLVIVRSGYPPANDVLTLLVVAVVAWSAGLWYFARRDIPAV